MIITVRISKSGNSKVVSLPKSVLKYYNLRVGDYIELDIKNVYKKNDKKSL